MEKKTGVDSSEVCQRADNLMDAASNRYQITVQVANRAKRRREEEMDNDEQLTKPVIRAIIEMSDELTQPDIIGESELSTAQPRQKLTEFPRDSSERDFDDLSYRTSYSGSNSDDQLLPRVQKTTKSKETNRKTERPKRNNPPPQTTQPNKKVEDHILEDALSERNRRSPLADSQTSPDEPIIVVPTEAEIIRFRREDYITPEIAQLQHEANDRAWEQLIVWIEEKILGLDLQSANDSVIRLKRRLPQKSKKELAHTLIVHKSIQAAGFDAIKNVPCAEILFEYIAGIDLSNLAKLSAEMIFQIGLIYGVFNVNTPRIQIFAEVLKAYASGLLAEEMIDQGIQWLKTGDVTSMALSAVFKGISIFQIGNTACIFYEDQQASFETLRERSEGYLADVDSGENLEEDIEDLIDQEIEDNFSIEYERIERNLPIDYENLMRYLQRNDWKKADQETADIIRELLARNGQELSYESVYSLPKNEIRRINQLWEENSNSRFGFRIQKHLYEESNKKIGDFGEKVGWRGSAGLFGGVFGWKRYDNLIFKADAPLGHLPAFGLDVTVVTGASTLDVILDIDVEFKLNISLKAILDRNDW